MSPYNLKPHFFLYFDSVAVVAVVGIAGLGIAVVVAAGSIAVVVVVVVVAGSNYHPVVLVAGNSPVPIVVLLVPFSVEKKVCDAGKERKVALTHFIFFIKNVNRIHID